MRNLLGAAERGLLGAQSWAETQVLDCGSKWLRLCLRRERLLKVLDGCKRRIPSIIMRLNVLEVFEVFPWHPSRTSIFHPSPALPQLKLLRGNYRSHKSWLLTSPVVRFHNEPELLQKIRDGLETQASCDWFPRRAELHSFVGGPSRLLALGRSSWFCCRLSGCPVWVTGCVSAACSTTGSRDPWSRPKGVKLCLGCCADVKPPSCSAVPLRWRCFQGWILSHPQGAELINAPVSVECGPRFACGGWRAFPSAGKGQEGIWEFWFPRIAASVTPVRTGNERRGLFVCLAWDSGWKAPCVIRSVGSAEERNAAWIARQ